MFASPEVSRLHDDAHPQGVRVRRRRARLVEAGPAWRPARRSTSGISARMAHHVAEVRAWSAPTDKAAAARCRSYCSTTPSVTASNASSRRCCARRRRPSRTKPHRSRATSRIARRRSTTPPVVLSATRRAPRGAATRLGL